MGLNDGKNRRSDPVGVFRGGGGLGVGGGLYGDASGREWEAEVVANSTGARDTGASRALGPKRRVVWVLSS